MYMDMKISVLSFAFVLSKVQCHRKAALTEAPWVLEERDSTPQMHPLSPLAQRLLPVDVCSTPPLPAPLAYPAQPPLGLVSTLLLGSELRGVARAVREERGSLVDQTRP